MMNTHNLMVDFGKYRGERWTRLPISYLRFIVNQFDTDDERRLLAESELARRGTTVPNNLEVSGHSIDRASQITHDWKDVGVHSWLIKIGEEALKEVYGQPEVTYKGFKFVFVYGNYYPTLKTIIKL